MLDGVARQSDAEPEGEEAEMGEIRLAGQGRDEPFFSKKKEEEEGCREQVEQGEHVENQRLAAIFG